VDLSGNLERYSIEIMQDCKRIMLVCTPEIPSLHLAREKINFLKTLDLDSLCKHAGSSASAPAFGPEPESDPEPMLAALFAEELGALLQVRALDRDAVLSRLGAEDLQAQIIGSPNECDEIRLVRGARPVFTQKRIDLQRAWSETTWRMQALRDNPECAQQESERILDADDPGLHAYITFDTSDLPLKGAAKPPGI
jgi:phosphoribosylformylglycinamidine synthase